MAFVSSGFEHCVANMYFIPAGLLTKAACTAEQIDVIGAAKFANLTWVTMWTNNIIVVTIGNHCRWYDLCWSHLLDLIPGRHSGIII